MLKEPDPDDPAVFIKRARSRDPTVFIVDVGSFKLVVCSFAMFQSILKSELQEIVTHMIQEGHVPLNANFVGSDFIDPDVLYIYIYNS
jgi:hypothetical protein